MKCATDELVTTLMKHAINTERRFQPLLPTLLTKDIPNPAQKYTKFICNKKLKIKCCFFHAFYYFTKMNSCCWAVASWRSCNHNFYFPNLTVTALLTIGIFNIPKPATAFLLLLWSTSLFCCIIADLQFLIFCTVCIRDTQHQQNPAL